MRRANDEAQNRAFADEVAQARVFYCVGRTTVSVVRGGGAHDGHGSEDSVADGLEPVQPVDRPSRTASEAEGDRLETLRPASQAAQHEIDLSVRHDRDIEG